MRKDKNLPEVTPRFKVGDVIELKSGGPRMTVKRIHENKDKAEIGYYCAWFVDGKLTNGFFPSETVIRTQDENPSEQRMKWTNP
jgi:uncharacterized protein YodC (DUF2158 family)